MKKSHNKSVGSANDKSWRRRRSKLSGAVPMSDTSDDDDYASVNTFSSRRSVKSKSKSKDDTAERDNLTTSANSRYERKSGSSQVDIISSKYDHQLAEMDKLLDQHRSRGEKRFSIHKDRDNNEYSSVYSATSNSSIRSGGQRSLRSAKSLRSSTSLGIPAQRISKSFTDTPMSSLGEYQPGIPRQSHSARAVSSNSDISYEPRRSAESPINVVLRIRPLTEQEEFSKLCLLIIPPSPMRKSRSSLSSRDGGDSVSANQQRPTMIKIKSTAGSKVFEFDNVFGPSDTTGELFDVSIVPAVNECLSQGYNATFMAHGPKNTGKTFTIFGEQNSKKSRSPGSPLKAMPPRKALTDKSPDETDSQCSDTTGSSILTDSNNQKLMQEQDGIVLRTLKHIFETLTEKVLSNLEPSDVGSTSRASFVSISSRSLNSTSLHSLGSNETRPPIFEYRLSLQIIDVRGDIVTDLIPVPLQSSLKHDKEDDMSVASDSARSISTKLTEDGTEDDDSLKSIEVESKYAKVDSYEQAAWCLNHAINSRKHLRNEYPGTHGHMIVTIHVLQKKRVRKRSRSSTYGKRGDEKYLLEVRKSKMRFVDLEERDISDQSQSNTVSNIQKGDDLTALRNVIYALSLQHSKNFNPSLVPFAQSKLTLLLKGSFTGNHKCVFIGCVTQSSLVQTETMSCLKLSRRAKMITNQMVPRVQTLSRSKTSKVLLKSTKKELQKNMSALDEKLALMTEELERLKAQTVKTTSGTRSTTSMGSHNKNATRDDPQKVISATSEPMQKPKTTIPKEGDANEECNSKEPSAVAVAAAAGVGLALASDNNEPEKASEQSKAVTKESSKEATPVAKETSADSGGSGITGAVGGAIAAVALGGVAVVGAVASTASTEAPVSTDDKASKKESSSSSTKEERKMAATTNTAVASVPESDATESSNTALVAGAVVGSTAAVAAAAEAEAGANTGERPREGNMQQSTPLVAAVQSKGEKSEQFSTNEIAGSSIILIDGMNSSDMDEASKLSKKRSRRQKNRLFTPRAYQTMPSISEYSDIDDDSNITPPSANHQDKSTDRVFHLTNFNSVSDISDDEDVNRSLADLTLVDTSLSGSEDEELSRSKNRGHQEIKATEEVKTILKVDSSSFKFNSNFAQSLVLIESNDGEKTERKDMSVKESSDTNKNVSSSKLSDTDFRSVGSNDVEQVLKEALGEESKITTENDHSVTSPPSDPFARDDHPKLFCGGRKRSGPPQPNCFISFFSKYFPEKASVRHGPGPINGLNSEQKH